MTMELLTGAAAIAEGESKLFARIPRPRDYNKKIVEAARILKGVETGSYAALGRLQEAMTTSDFPYYLAAVIDKELLPRYQSIQPLWPSFCRRTEVRDFRKKKFVDLFGGRGILQPVGEAAPYPEAPKYDTGYELAVGKLGRRFALTFEDFVNDDLGDFKTLPDDLSQAARDTEDYTATAQVATATGPNTAFFRTAASGDPAAFSNAPTALPLTMDNLTAAINLVTGRTDYDNRPIDFPKLVLMVPPGLRAVANNLVNAIQIDVTDGSNKLKVNNWISSQITPLVNPWLTAIDRTSKANATWYLLPDPSTPRPALVLGFLKGHLTPDLRVKADTGSPIGGGGSIDPTEGSFDDDTVQYRVRHVTGGASLDRIGTYASTGS